MDSTEPRIKFFCRSFDLKLYRISKATYEGLGYSCIRLTDQSADGYFFTMLEDTDCDIAVNVDEDAFVTDPEAVMDLVKKVWAEGYANAGYSDGDKATTGRDKLVTNPFFNILNLKLIRSRFNKSLLVRSYTDAEPYYPFFRWMAGEFKTLYLPCRRHQDGITTIAEDTEGRTVCLHTWFSRFYSMPSLIVRRIEPQQGMQKERIDAVINEVYHKRNLPGPDFNPADRFIFILDKTVRWVVKIPQRISRWPYKLKRRFARKKLISA